MLEFAFTAPDPMTIWLVLEHGEVSVCLQHPGFDTDVHLRATTAAFSDLFNGPRRRGARRCVTGASTSPGRRGWSASVPTWFLWSPWHEVDAGARGPGLTRP